MSKEVAVRKLLQACEKDPELFAKLIATPKEVAEQFGVALEPEEVEQLQKVQKLRTLVGEFKQGRVVGPPLGYPIDVAWKNTILNHIKFYNPIFYPIFYPIPDPIYQETAEVEAYYHRPPKGYPMDPRLLLRSRVNPLKGYPR
jgi:hypothetical protein